MAELDDKLLKNLDKTLEDMTTHLQGIETALKGVKNGLEATFNPDILKSFYDELRGMKAARLIDAEDNVSQVNKIYSAIQEFDRRVKTGTKLEFLSEEQIEKYKQELNEIEKQLDAVANKRLKGQEWLDRRALYERRNMLRDIVTSDQPAVSVPLSTAELKEAVELLKKYKELYAGITKGEQQRAVELANIYAKERKADMKSADDALAQTEQEERKKFEIERAWNEKSTKEAEQRDKQKLATEKATADERLAIIDAEAKKRAEMEKAWAEHDKQVAASRTDLNKLGDLAATRGLTGNLATLQDTSAYKRYMEERKADMKSADDALAQTEQEERKKFEIERAWNEKSTKEAEQRDKQKLATEKATADERLAIIDAEAKKRAEMEQGWAEIERQRQEREARAAKEMAQMGDIAATPNKTGNLAELKEIEKEQGKFQKQREDDEKKLAEIRRGNTQARLQDEQHAEKMIAEERARRAKEAEDAAKQRFKEAQEANKAWTQAANAEQKAQAKMRGAESKQAYREQTEAIRQQIVYQKQLMALRKEYIALNQKKDRTDKESADLERIKTKIKEIINLSKQLNKEQAGTHNIAFKATEYERFRQSIKGATKATKEHNAELDKMLPTLQRLASAFGIAFSIRGLAQFGKKLIEVRGEFELQQVALRSILQNKQLADEIWDKTLRAALQSPYTAMQLTKYTKQLAAYRIETAKLFDTTKRLADVSAGLGVDMQRLILAYGQVKAANYLRASEIRQFTEAGVNILGELSQYFTEAKGEMVSTAQVMDMVQKRMVKFEDVAEIFKRMTDQGGIFYNMQYIQSQTVKGQLMKLRDAYDQMLNTIGKGNEGTIKNLISLLNDMVRNWRSIAIALKSIGWGIAINWVGKYALALTGLTKVTKTTAAGIVKLKTVLSSLSSFITLPTILISIATALLSMQQRMRAVNKEIDEQNYKLYESQKYFEELRYKIHLNNSYIDDETSSEEENTQAKEANRAIMQKLINEYPQLAAQMEINEDGLISMNDALDANIRKLKEQRTLVNAMKTQSMFSDTDQKNLADWEMKLSSIRVKMSSVQSEAEQLVSAMKDDNLQGTKLYEIYTKIAELDIAKDVLGAARAFEEMSRAIQDMPFPEFDKLNDELGDFDEYKLPSWWGGFLERKMGLGHPLLPWSGSFEMYDMWGDENRAISALDNIQSELMRYYRNGIQDNEEYLEEVGDMTTEEFIKWLVENAGRLNKDTAEGINKANEIFIKTLAPQSDEMKSYLNKYFNNLLGIDEMAFVRAEARLGLLRQKVAEHEALPQLGMLENPDRIAAYEAVLKEIEQLESFLKNRGIDFFATAENIGGTTEPDFELNAANLRKQVNLLEEMKKRYDELSKSAYGYAKSEEKVRQAFKNSFEEIFKGSGIDMKDIDFTSMEGLSASIKKVLDAATNIKEEVKQEIMKKIDSYEARIEIDAQVRVRENFAREIEQMFSDYELTLELQKLNISPSAAKNLFPELDYKTMGDLQDRMRRFYQEQVAAGGFDEKDLETYRKFADKIDAEILKDRKERAKQYSKFLEQEYSERAKVEMQYAQDVAFVTTNFEDTQRENILKGLQQKFSKDISELNWKSFKESDFYLDMMEDLSSLPKDYLDMMLKKIEQVLTENKDGLSPRTLKEIVKARQRVLDAQIKLRPLDVMRSSIEGIRAASKDETVGGGTWRATNKNLKENIKLQADQIAQFDKEILSLQKLQGELAGYEELTARFKAISSRIDLGVLNSLLGLGEDESIADVGTMEISNITALIERLTAGLDAAKEAYDPTQKTDEMNKLAVEISQREIMIKLLGEELEIRREISEYQLSPQAMKAMTQGQTSAGIGAQISEEEGKKETTEKRQLKFKEWLKSFDNFGEAYKELNKNINNTITSVANAGSAFYDMFEALGGETDALTEGWKEFGSTMISTITQALTMIPTMVTAFVTAGTAINAALGIIGLIAEALQLLFVAIGAIAKLHDSQYEKEIEEQQKRIDELKKAYDRLEKSIEKTWDTMSYIRDYNDMIDNLEQQRDALNKQIAAEENKKDTDSDKLQGYKDSIQEIDDQLEDLKQKQIEVFGGLGEVNYRSAAQEFVDAWKEAFLETGDGLQGLQEHFDEFLNEWFVKQATMRIAGRMLATLFEDIDKAVDQYNAGGTDVLMSELNAIREKFGIIAPQLSDALEALAGQWGLGEGEGGLSGLAAGIQGMTEEQANILEAYWNSVRAYTASIDMNVSRIADMLGAGSRDITNPQLQQLQLIAANAQATHQLLLSTSKSGHPMGGYGFKVFND